LRGELYRSVLLAYLWCRIIDTVEDAPGVDSGIKVKALREFAGLFEQLNLNLEAMTAWAGRLSELKGAPDELDLLHHTEHVTRCFCELPETHRRAIRPSVIRMAQGMADFQQRMNGAATIALRDEEDLDRYCYYVAGTVGELLTQLFLLQGRLSTKRRSVLERHAVSFGLGLQLTNITKDVMIDCTRGWCYVPTSFLDRVQTSQQAFLANADPDTARRVVGLMILKAERHLNDGLAYTLALPPSWRRIRLFCIWPLWMAIHTLRMMASPGFTYQHGESPKIDRSLVRRIVRVSSLCFWSDTWLKSRYEDLAVWVRGQVPSPKEDQAAHEAQANVG